jgi:hypothetical protein
MKLLHEDVKASDPLYHKIQEDHPSFDPPSLLKDRVETLYETCHKLVDKKFRSQIKHDFASCYSELYFCTTFIKRLSLDVTHPSDKGPDYYLQDLDCWAEIVTATDGEKDNTNSIPETKHDVANEAPRRQIILRITNSFTYKAEKIFEYVKNSLISDSQKVIICINGGWFAGLNRFPLYPVGGFPQVVNALLPIGDMVLMINRGDMSVTERKYEFRDHVIKEKTNNIESIRTDYFLDPKYSCISAVIYSYANVTDSIEVSDLGRDFFIIHNPLATNKLPLGSIKCGVEYKVEVDDELISITTIKH